MEHPRAHIVGIKFSYQVLQDFGELADDCLMAQRIGRCTTQPSGCSRVNATGWMYRISAADLNRFRNRFRCGLLARQDHAAS